jgi:hypothetical protein
MKLDDPSRLSPQEHVAMLAAMGQATGRMQLLRQLSRSPAPQVGSEQEPAAEPA